MDFSDDNVGTPYDRSKTLAEKAAWKFVEELPEDEKFELCCVNPGLILGTPLVKCKFSSADFIKMLVMRETPGTPAITIPLVDVIDVAQAHLNCITIDEAANKRFVLC